MKYTSIEPGRCLYLNEMILKPFLCDNCKNFPLKAFKLSLKSFNYYCESCTKKFNSNQIFEDNLNFTHLIIACKFYKNGCKKEFYCGNHNDLFDHENNCKYDIHYVLISEEIQLKNLNDEKKNTEQMKEDLIKNYEEKLKKIKDEFELEKSKSNQKLQFLIEQNNILEIKLFNKLQVSSLIISNEIQMNIEKTLKVYQISETIKIIYPKLAKDPLKISNSSFVNISKKEQNLNDSKYKYDEKPFLKSSKIYGGLPINSAQNDQSIQNSLFSTSISNNKDNLHYNSSQSLFSSLSTSLFPQKNDLSKTVNFSETEILPQKKNELKSVLNKMDSRYFNNFKLIEKLNNIQLNKLSKDIKQIVTSAEDIPLKMDGTMDMRFNISKGLVALFKRYELLTNIK